MLLAVQKYVIVKRGQIKSIVTRSNGGSVDINRVLYCFKFCFACYVIILGIASLSNLKFSSYEA